MNRRPSRRAEEFAAALEGAPAADPAVASLARLAERLQAVPLAPTPDFSAALRQRLVESAGQAVAPSGAVPGASAVAAPAAPSGLSGMLAGPLGAVTSGLVATVVAVTGTGVAASRSLPGDPFYAVKRLAEGVQLSFADGAVARAEALLDQARERLGEVSALLDGHALPLDPSTARLVEDTLSALDDRVREAADLLLRAGDSRAARLLADFTADSRMRLSSLAASLPSSLADDASGVLARMDLTGRTLLPPAPGPGGRGPLPTQVPTVPVPTAPTVRPTDLPTLPVPTLPVPTQPVPSVPVPTVPVPTVSPSPGPTLPTLPTGLPTPLPF